MAMVTDKGNITTPDAGDLNTAARKYAASQGWAMSDGSYPIRPLDNHGKADLQKAIHAVGRGNANHAAIQAHIKKRASALGLSNMIPDGWSSRSIQAVPTTVPGLHTRYVPLDDLVVHSRAQGGDGRTVTAYAAVFNQTAEVHDQDGNYLETNAPTAFNKTLGDRSRNIPVLYNHGKTLFGTIAERFSMPLGKVLDIKADNRGLLTTVRYNRSDLADEVLASIENGDITGQSYSGYYIKSNPMQVPRGGFRADRNGKLTTVTRQEIKLVEFGPTPMPNFQGAEILAVRSALELLQGYGYEMPINLNEGTFTATTPEMEPERDALHEGAASADEPLRKHSSRAELLASIRRRRIAKDI